MNVMAPMNAKALYQTVGTLGLTRAQVRRLLPEWWSVEAESTPDGVMELSLHLARRLSIDASSLLEGRITPRGAVSHIAYKHQAGAARDGMAAATFIASSLAQAAIAALPTPFDALPSTPAELRRRAAESGRGGALGFSSLLELCWNSGIPVIPLSNLPVGIRKMDGAALLVGNRPAIVIAKRKSSRAWLSFILAHEMAHIALGHIEPGSSIIDVSLQDSATYAAESSGDTQEREADAFALSVLGGEEVTTEVSRWSDRLSAVELAVAARTAGARLNVEAGHLILRHAFIAKRWAESSAALGFISEDLDAESALAGYLQSRLDLKLIAEDLRDMVSQITGLRSAESE